MDPSPPRKELQGPRPAPLKVHKSSHIIRKPPLVPAFRPPVSEARPPVIIYTESPKVIHADPEEFMKLVQRLTGFDPPLPEKEADRAEKVNRVGILSPGPESLPPIHSGVFAGADPNGIGFLLSDFSPTGVFSNMNMSIPSPFPASLIYSPQMSQSPAPSFDLFNNFSNPKPPF